MAQQWFAEACFNNLSHTSPSDILCITNLPIPDTMMTTNEQPYFLVLAVGIVLYCDPGCVNVVFV
jgi:hypothetical protein